MLGRGLAHLAGVATIVAVVWLLGPIVLVSRQGGP
jgi:hypothetical protein